MDSFRVNCQKIPLTWKIFPQTPFAAFVTNMWHEWAKWANFQQNSVCAVSPNFTKATMQPPHPVVNQPKVSASNRQPIASQNPVNS